MRDESMILRDRQRAIRCEMDKRGIHLKQVQFDSKIKMSTLLSYFPGGEREPAVMPISAVYVLLETRALPDDMLNQLLPGGVVLARITDMIDFDDFSALCRKFNDLKSEAHREDSPAGPALSACEQAALMECITAILASNSN